MENQPQKKTSLFKRRLKQIGFIGFLFFLIKGLIWLVIIYFLAK